MNHNPEKNSPRMFDLSKLKNGLSKEQLAKVQYECNLLRIDLQNDINRALAIIPFLFQEGVTASNTIVIPDVKEPVTENVWTYSRHNNEYDNDYNDLYYG